MRIGRAGRTERAVQLGLVLLLAGHPSLVPAQPPGTVEGYVFDAATGKGLRGARVSVFGRRVQTRTDDSGFYRLRKLPTGSINLRIELVGYAVVVEQVAVEQVTVADFSLFPAATVLEAVVVEGAPPGRPSSGDGARSVTVRTEESRSPAAASTGELVARVPGARVIRLSGQVGAGTAIQLRGIKSFITSGDPVVYLDGVRVADRGTGGLSGRFRGPTVLDLIDPSSIDRIEVLPGAAAAAMYGDGAANGVILVYTKQGGK